MKAHIELMHMHIELNGELTRATVECQGHHYLDTNQKKQLGLDSVKSQSHMELT